MPHAKASYERSSSASTLTKAFAVACDMGNVA
uniref:Uncharacterized protein n=1 Tax=Anguilla anguilla TaxID=7936 RepID=A0A0E9TJJ9_ANGAN